MTLSQLCDKLRNLIGAIEVDLERRDRNYVHAQFNGHNLHAHVEETQGKKWIVWRVDGDERETYCGILEACMRPAPIVWRLSR